MNDEELRALFESVCAGETPYKEVLPYLSVDPLQGTVLWSLLRAKHERLLDHLIANPHMVAPKEWATDWGKMLRHKTEDKWEAKCAQEREEHEYQRWHYCAGLDTCPCRIYFYCSKNWTPSRTMMMPRWRNPRQ